MSATGSITYSSSSTSTSEVMGIFNFGLSNWTTNNNNIGGITVSNSSTGAANFYGLRCNTSSTATWTASNNTIGGAVANSTQSTTTATGTIVNAILNSNPVGTFTANIIRNMTVAGGTGTGTSASILGITLANSANNTLSQNTIFNLSNTNTSAATVVTGIQFNGGSANVVERNFIYGLTSSTNSTSAEINGIRVAGGTTIYKNNMIALGAGVSNALGSAATNSSTTGINGFNGFLGTDSFWNNSVYIGGTATSGSGASYAFNGTQTTNTRNFRNNVFVNARTNSGATGKHYAIKINGSAANPTGLTINYNVYNVSGTGGTFGYFNSADVADLSAWQSAVGQDANSLYGDPQYIAPAASTPDLHIHPTNPTPTEGAGVAIASVTNDYDGQTRSGLTPVDIGADAGNFTAPLCASAPTGLLSNTVMSSSANITWTAPSSAPANGYEYYVSTSSTAPTSGTTPTGTTLVGVTNAALSSLLPSTQYYFWVRANCDGTNKSPWSSSATFTTLCAPVSSFPWTENFDSMSVFGANILPNCWLGITGTKAWTSTNAAQSTTSPGPNSGANYVRLAWSNTAASDLLTPGFSLSAGQSYDFSFYYKTAVGTNTAGGGFTGDLYVNTSQSATGATLLGSVVTSTVTTNGYVQYKYSYTPSSSGVYYFDLRATSDAATATWYMGVDDFRLELSPACSAPASVSATTSIAATSATINWTASPTSPTGGYEWEVRSSGAGGSGATGLGASGTVAAGVLTANVTGLLENTAYTVYVRSNCGGAGYSTWASGGAFTTPQTPATLPYTDSFSANSYTFVNGSETNKWTYGSAAGNPANAIYVSNDSGVTNAYTNTVTSVVQSYRDIAIPAGATAATLKFDWKNNGESGFDYIRVWMVPSTFVPTAGTQITSGSGRIQVGGNLNGVTTWQTYSNTALDVSTFANATMRLVFEWRNDSSGGSNPPGAIDNVNLFIPDPITITPSGSTTLCSGGSVDLTATSTTAYTYAWSPATGLSSTTGATVTANPAVTTTYTVTGTSGAIVITKDITVTVNPLPTDLVVAETPVNVDPCGAEYVTLSATGGLVSQNVFSENFNTVTPGLGNLPAGWSRTNAFSAFRWFASSTNSAGGVANEMALSYNGAGTDGTGNWNLNSPAITSTGFTSMKASFKYNLGFFSAGSFTIKLQTSTDSSLWTDRWSQTFTSTSGSDIYTNSPAAADIDLSALDGTSTIYLRFVLSGNSVNLNTFSMDDVAVTGNVQLPVTWSPATGLYTDTALTTPYNGTDNLKTVYAAPQSATAYTAKSIAGSCEKTTTSSSVIRIKNEFIGAGTDWNTASNWFPSSVPDAGKCANIPAGKTVVIDIDAAAKSLTIAETGKLTINSNKSLTVTDVINITNNIANDNLVMESDASLNQISNMANTGKILAKRDIKMRKLDYTFWSSPVDTQLLRNTSGTTNPSTYNTGGFSPGTPNNRIYYYEEPTDFFRMTTDAYFVPGKAYAVRGKDAYYSGTSTTTLTSDTFQFVGVPNNGNDISVGIQKSKNTGAGGAIEHGYNLIGNPYPSNLDFISFYNFDQGAGVYNRDKILGKAWFWTNSSPIVNQSGSSYAGSNYAVLSLAGAVAATGVDAGETTGSPTPTQNIKMGQGFIVQMKGTAPTGTTPSTATLKFDNSMRTNDAGYFYNNNKSAAQKDRYWLKLVSPENISNMILVAHLPETTNAYDQDYDAELLMVGDDSFYSRLNTQKLQIQARQKFVSNEDVIPLGTKYAGNGTYKIGLVSREGIFAADQKIYLFDKLNNSYTDLTSNIYTFTANKGTDETRFEIVYQSKEVLAVDGSKNADFVVYRDGEYFVIKSSQKLGNVDLYDASGKLIISRFTTQKELRLDASGIVSGVYIIKAMNSDNVKTRKIIK